MLRTWKILCSRGGFHLGDIKSFPYFEPDAAPNPATARRALATVSRYMDEIAKLPCTKQPARYQELRKELDQLVYRLFRIDSRRASTGRRDCGCPHAVDPTIAAWIVSKRPLNEM